MPKRLPTIRLYHALGALLLLLSALNARAQTAASLTPVPMIQFSDASTGIMLPCAGCTVSTFVAGSSTPVKTYVDSTATTQNPLVITLNSLGMTTSGIWLGGTACYKFSLANPAGAVLWTQDQICANSVTSFNTRTGAITLTAGDVAAVEQDLRTSASPTFVAVTATTFFNCAATSTNPCAKQASGTWTINGQGDFAGQSITTGANNGSVATAGAASVINYSGGTTSIHAFDTGGSCAIGTGQVSPGIACTSDARLKRGEIGIRDGLGPLLGLRPVTYIWRGSGQLGVGFIAQEVRKVLPRLVTVAPGPNPDGILMLSQEGMTPYIVRAIQQQQAEIEALFGLVAALAIALGGTIAAVVRLRKKEKLT